MGTSIPTTAARVLRPGMFAPTGHPRPVAPNMLVAEQLEARRPGTVETAELVVQDAIERTQAAHEALWRQLRRSEKVVLAGVADGVPPASPALATEHQLGRNTLHEAAERMHRVDHRPRHARGERAIAIEIGVGVLGFGDARG